MRPGLHSYSTLEATAFDRAQIGFVMMNIANGHVGNRIEIDFTDLNWQNIFLVDTKWGSNEDVVGTYGCIGFITEDVSHIQARTKTFDNGVKHGDDLAKNGLYNGSNTVPINYLDLSKGTMWGNFDKVALWHPAAGNYTVKLIIGKWRE